MNSLELRQLAQRLRVPLGFVVAPLLLIFASPRPLSLLIGAAIALAGLGIRAWASGHLNKMAELTTSGPYAYTRNPLYFGTFLLVVGVAVATNRWYLALIAAASYLVVYIPVMLAEVDTMRERFPGAYETWAASVPLFFPRPFASSVSADGACKQFDSSLYLRYREYRAAIGLAAVFLFLIGKMYLNGYLGL